MGQESRLRGYLKIRGQEGLEIELSIGSRVIDTWKKHRGVRVTCMGCNRVPLTRRLIAIVVTLLVVTHHRAYSTSRDDYEYSPKLG